MYAFTLFSGFLASVSQDLARVAPIALALAAVSFAATSTCTNGVGGRASISRWPPC
jgi:hypothetical protein